MNAQSPPPPPASLMALLWQMLRLGARTLWSSQANRLRPLLERQQALAVLGLPPNATPEQIKRRYRALAKRYHPDRGGDARQMQRIIAAYEILTHEQPH
jgi:DnaJ-domain-containing protein 1